MFIFKCKYEGKKKQFHFWDGDMQKKILQLYLQNFSVKVRKFLQVFISRSNIYIYLHDICKYAVKPKSLQTFITICGGRSKNKKVSIDTSGTARLICFASSSRPSIYMHTAFVFLRRQ